MALKPWGEVVASPEYANASPEQQAQYRQQYSQAGGQIPSTPVEHKGLADRLGDTIASGLKAGAAGFGHSVAEGLGGAVEAVGDITHSDTISTYGKRMEQRANEVQQRRMSQIQEGVGKKYGGTVGNVAGDIAMFAADAPLAAGVIGGREFGKAYAEQKPEDKSLLKAGLVGAANVAATKMLPGAGGEAAEGLIGSAINTAKNTVKNAWAGAKGGAIVGAAQGVNENKDLGGVIGSSLEGAGSGAAFGGTLGAVHSIGGDIVGRVAKNTQDVAPNAPAPVAAKIGEQARTIADAPTPEARAEAFKEAPHLNAVNATKLLQDRGIDVTNAAFHRNEAGQEVHGLTPEDITRSRSEERNRTSNLRFVGQKEALPGSKSVHNEQIEALGQEYLSDVKGSLTGLTDKMDGMVASIKRAQEEAGGGADAAATAQQLSALKAARQEANTYRSAMLDADGIQGAKQDRLMQAAKDFHESLQKLDPDTAAEVMKGYTPVKGLSETLDPIADAATHNAAVEQLTNMNKNWKGGGTNETSGSTTGEGSVAHPTVLGIARDVLKTTVAGRIRNQRLAEAEANRARTTELAKAASAAERSRATVEQAKAQMDEPPVQDYQPEMEADTAPAPETPAQTPPTELASLSQRLQQRAEEQRRAAEEAQAQQAAPEEQAPVQEEQAPSEPLPAATETPAQRLRRQAEENARQAEEARAAQAAQEAPETSTEPLPSQRPAQPKKPVEEPTEAPEATPKEEPTWHQKTMKGIAQRTLQKIKNKFVTPEVKEKVTEANMNDKHVIAALRREDMTLNTKYWDEAAKQTVLSRKQFEAGKHKHNIAELESWSKETGIPHKFVQEAIEQKGLTHSNILGINDIQSRAEKLYRESLKHPPEPTSAQRNAQSVEENMPHAQQKSSVVKEVAGMRKEVQSVVLPIIERKFRVYQHEGETASMPASQLRDLRTQIYNEEARVLEKLGKDEEAAAAKAKAEKEAVSEETKKAESKAKAEREAKNLEETKRLQAIHDLNVQTDDIHAQMHEAVKGFDDKELAERFINSYMNENFGGLKSTPMTEPRFNAARKQAIADAKDFAKKAENANLAEKEKMVQGKDADESLDKASQQFEEHAQRTASAERPEGVDEDTAASIRETITDKAERAFRHGDDVDTLIEAANQLSKHYYGAKDTPATHSIRRYAQVVKKAADYKEEYPNHPELWLSQDDVSSISRAGDTIGGGMKSKAIQLVTGKTYADVEGKLLSEADRTRLAKAVDKAKREGAPEPKSIGFLSSAKRESALGKATEEAAKPTVKVKVVKKAAAEKTADEKRLATLKRKLYGKGSEERYMNMRGNERGAIHKADMAEYNHLKEKVQKAKRK